MSKPTWVLQVHLSYNYGGDTGPCTMVDETVGPVDYEQLLKDIDRLTEELREKAK